MQISFLPLFLFSPDQMYQACSNITTNERMRHFRYKHFRDERTNKYVNPFNRGWIRNFFDSLDVGIPKIIQPTPIGKGLVVVVDDDDGVSDGVDLSDFGLRDV